jgi:exodeoxyribonuclease VII large subunit
VVRPVQLGRERLDARAQRLPRPEALLAAAMQSLDDRGERLRRGLHERTVTARHALQKASAGVSAPLLLSRLGRARERLAAARLAPTLVTRRLAEARERTATLWRMAEQLSPARVLERGYAIVRDEMGKPVLSAAAARTKTSLELEFADGKLALGQQGAGTRPARPVPAQRTPPPEPSPVQGKLL